MDKEYSPFTMLEAHYWAEAALNMPLHDVEQLQRFLRQRALDVGCDEGVPDVISGMTDRFVDEEREMLRKRMDEQVRRWAIKEQQRIDASDEQIVKAIKKTLKAFESDWDWGGVHRILVDYCHHLGFSTTKTKFAERFARMGIYPKDNTVKVDRSAPPAIFLDEYCGHQFSYQAIVKGLDPYWPSSYQDWKMSNITTNDFIARRKIAETFLRNLVEATMEPPQLLGR